MSAEDVIADHGQRYDEDMTAWLSCRCGWRIDTERIDYSADPDVQADRQYAAHVLDALRSNGFEVVELPEPEPDFSRYPWWDLQAGEVVADRPDEVQLIATGCLPLFFSPRSARDVAAALLAAARHAEEGTP